MILYHFTSSRYLRGIAQHGLTVGDVPTDARRGTGRVGVWLTTAIEASGHGLEGGALWKGECRIAVDVPDEGMPLVRWTEWAPRNVTPETINGLHSAGRTLPETWFIYFGWIKPDRIVEVVSMVDGLPVADWPNIKPSEDDLPGVPYWRRAAWQKRMLRDVARAVRASR